jgi:hypothetical protein
MEMTVDVEVEVEVGAETMGIRTPTHWTTKLMSSWQVCAAAAVVVAGIQMFFLLLLLRRPTAAAIGAMEALALPQGAPLQQLLPLPLQEQEQE